MRFLDRNLEKKSSNVSLENPLKNGEFFQSSLIPDPKLYVWDIENDAVIFFNFASGKNDQVHLTFALILCPAIGK